MTRTQRALAMVTQALRKLEPDQSRIKRKHARADVFGAIRALENAVYSDFPTIPRRRTLKAVNRSVVKCVRRAEQLLAEAQDDAVVDPNTDYVYAAGTA